MSVLRAVLVPCSACKIYYAQMRIPHVGRTLEDYYCDNPDSFQDLTEEELLRLLSDVVAQGWQFTCRGCGRTHSYEPRSATTRKEELIQEICKIGA